jgi:hypothetical protein
MRLCDRSHMILPITNSQLLMILNLFDRIGNWNPQLFREIKGRLTGRNIAIASALSLGAQLLLFMYFSALIVAPPHGEYTYPIHRTFCTFDDPNHYSYEKKCVRDALGNFAINWSEWWSQIFMWLTVLSILAILVAGTYMLVSDLDKEEKRGTLNFIRLSPQSAKTIFIGKILGVPILLYLAAILAVPLHLYSGLAAQIPLNEIFCFYIAVLASCALFYSAAMLFGLTTSWLGGFQPWLASGMAFVMCWISALGLSMIYESQWFYLPVNKNIAIGHALSLLVCGTGIYWLWQGWQRRFPNPSATVLSKQQSYLVVICYQVIMLGFSFQVSASAYPSNRAYLLLLNLLMFLALIAALTPDRQSLYDWARYRQQIVPSSKKLWRRYPLLDLIWSEKSPAVVAIAINLFISVIIFIPWMLFQKIETREFWRVICCLNLILIYATITQLFLFTKNRNREIWAAGTVASAILLPPLILDMLSIAPATAPILWLSSTFPILWLSSTFASFWYSSYFIGLENTILFAILGQCTVLMLLNLKLRSQLKLAGQSASKALLKA